MTSADKTVRLTVAQAVVMYLSRQYSVADGRRRRLVPATLGIFGHGNVAGLGQALDQLSDVMPFIQGRNEQALVHAAAAFAKLQHPLEGDVTVNDAFRPVCRFFDRITRPGQLLTALPAAVRVLTDPVDAGAVVLSLPQDIQSHACDWPAGFFAGRDWVIRRPQPDGEEVAAVLALLAAAARPLIIAGGGVLYSGATAELERLAGNAGIPVLETFAGKGAVQQRAWWQIGGIGLEGTPAANTLAREADLVLTVGARLTDFATASHSLFAHPGVRFASINVDPRDAGRLGATGIIADARQGLAALADGAAQAGLRAPAAWRARAEQVSGEWAAARAAALDPGREFSPAQAGPDVVAGTDAVLTQGQVIGVLQEHARPGDVVIAAAGGPPGDLLKVWDATGGRHCHLEFGFSCMGYEIPAAIGVRLADPGPAPGSSRSWATGRSCWRRPNWSPPPPRASRSPSSSRTTTDTRSFTGCRCCAAAASSATSSATGPSRCSWPRGKRRRRRGWRATTSAWTWSRSRRASAPGPAASRPRPNSGTRCPPRAITPARW